MHTILTVDDSRLARLTLRQLLESAGYAVQEAKDVDEALEQYPRTRPDLVLLDLLMPKTHALEALRKFRTIYPEARVVRP
jgi:two-component system, NarL family, invasion response regulator UvrY